MADIFPNGNSLTSARVFNKKLMKKGVILFITISIVTFIGIFLYTKPENTLRVWKEIHWIYILVSLLLLGIDLYIGGLRNHLFIREFVPGIKVWISVKANLANIFMGAITPSQSGGAPAQWYIFYRNGVSIPDSMGNSFYNWISTIVFFPLSGIMAIFILKGKVPDGLVMHLTQFGFGVFTSLLLVIIIGLFAPNVFEKIVGSLGSLIARISKSFGNKVKTYGEKGLQTLTNYRAKYLGLIYRKPHLMLFGFILTVILYFNKYLLAWLLVIAFGIDVDFWTIIAIQAVVYLLLYFAPSPGGSGIAEISISALMAGIIHADYIVSFTLLYRSLLFFIPAIIGSLIVLKQISKE